MNKTLIALTLSGLLCCDASLARAPAPDQSTRALDDGVASRLSLTLGSVAGRIDADAPVRPPAAAVPVLTPAASVATPERRETAQPEAPAVGEPSRRISWARNERSSPELSASSESQWAARTRTGGGPRNEASPAPVAPGRFDLVVNNAPAAQVFLQIGAGSGLTMLVSPETTGNVTLNLRNTNAEEALEALHELYGYEYRMASNNRVFVQSNAVQTRLFKINYLPGRRTGASDLRVSSSAMAQAAASTGATTTAGSSGTSRSGATMDTSSVRMTSDNDFWAEVRATLLQLIAPTSAGQREAGDGVATSQRSVAVNPSAGVIVVRGTPSELRKVRDYLRAIQVSIDRQVMLEAKIVEVKLTKATEKGINWSAFRGVASGGVKSGVVGMSPGVTLSNNGAIANGNITLNPGTSAVTTALGNGFYGLAVQSANFSAFLSFLESQGEVKVLSSPRVATLNNQKAVLKVGNDEMFAVNFTAASSSSGTTNSNGTNTTTTIALPVIQPFFSGVALDVTPQIDDTGMVMLHVHPTVSVVKDQVKEFDVGAEKPLSLPLALSSINEIDSIVRVRDGQIVAIGGLMQQRSLSDRNGVPGLSDAPLIGGLFRYQSDSDSKYELVILIKPTVIAEDGVGFEGEAEAMGRFKQ